MGGFLFVFGMYYDNMNTMKNDTEIKIQEILDEMQQMFKTAIGPRNRREYMNSIGVSGRDWHFSLTPEQIISNKIPAQVIGCTGIAKLFCKLATDRELKVFVVCTAKFDDWMAAKQDNNKTINNGHQLNAVEIDGILRVFDAGRRRVHFIDTNLKPGSLIDALQKGTTDYLLTAVVPGKQFLHMDTYQKLCNLYTSGDMNNPNFTITPELK